MMKPRGHRVKDPQSVNKLTPWIFMREKSEIETNRIVLFVYVVMSERVTRLHTCLSADAGFFV